MNAYQKRLAQRQAGLLSDRIRLAEIKAVDGWKRCQRFDELVSQVEECLIKDTMTYQRGWYFYKNHRYNAKQIDLVISQLECIIHQRNNPHLEIQDE